MISTSWTILESSRIFTCSWS